MKGFSKKVAPSLLCLALLCGKPSSVLGQGPQYITPPLPETIKPSYKSKILEDEISTTPEEHVVRCSVRIGPASKNYRMFLNSCEVYFYSGVEPHTGGHKHDNEHDNPEKPGETLSKYLPLPRPNVDEVQYPSSHPDPKLRLIGTYNAPPGLAFKIEASIVGQTEGFVLCNGFPEEGLTNCSSHEWDVKYSNPNLSNFRGKLEENDGKDNDTMVAIGYQVPPGDPPHPHPHNHYGTSTFNKVLEKIAQQYYDEFSCYEEAEDGTHLGYQPIGVNDMSLPYGGVFDVNQNWKTPHSSPGHHKGLAADIRVKDPKKFPATKKNSVIYKKVVIDRFIQICKDNGMTYVDRYEKYIGTANEHIHIEIR